MLSCRKFCYVTITLIGKFILTPPIMKWIVILSSWMSLGGPYVTMVHYKIMLCDFRGQVRKGHIATPGSVRTNTSLEFWISTPKSMWRDHIYWEPKEPQDFLAFQYIWVLASVYVWVDFRGSQLPAGREWARDKLLPPVPVWTANLWVKKKILLF
jgi:hypothetical protein